MHIYHQRHIHRYHWTEMRELFASLTIQAFGIALIRVFLPIFLLTIGIPFDHVALYFIFWGLAMVPLHFVLGAMVRIIGVKHTLALSYIFSIAAFSLIGFSKEHSSLLLPGFVFYALADVFYWDSRHIESSSIIPKKKTGQNVSVIMVLVALSTALGPLLGGVIGQRYGLTATLYVACAVILIAIFPLFATKEISYRKQRAKAKPFPKRDLVANFAYNFEMKVAGTLWPIFVYLLIGNLASLGLLFSIGLIANIAITLIVGPLSDKGYRKPLIIFSSYTRALVHGARIIVASVSGAYAVNTSAELAASFGTAPYGATFYRNARAYGIMRYVIRMEVMGSLATACVWGIAYGAVQITSLKAALITLFVMAVVITPLQTVITKR